MKVISINWWFQHLISFGRRQIEYVLEQFQQTSDLVIQFSSIFTFICEKVKNWIFCCVKALLRDHFGIKTVLITSSKWLKKPAPRTTSGPRDLLKWSANCNTNWYLVLRALIKFGYHCIKQMITVKKFYLIALSGRLRAWASTSNWIVYTVTPFMSSCSLFKA